MTSKTIGEPRESPPLIHCVELGLASGVLAGVVYLVAASSITRLLGGHVASPLRLPATVVLGPAALGGFFPASRAVFVGVGTDLLTSAILGSVWVLALRRMGWLRAHPLVLAPLGAAYGALIWFVGDVVLGALALPQIAVADLIWSGIIAHAVFFGGALAVAVLLLMDRPDHIEQCNPERGDPVSTGPS